MRKLLIVLAAAVALSGCAQLQNAFTAIANPATQQTLVEAESAYGAALAIAVGYRNACAARTIPASCRKIVPQLQAADRKVQGAIVAARNFIRDNPTISPISAIQAVQKAISDFQTVEATYGVQ